MADRTLTITHHGQTFDVVRHKPKYTHLRVPSSDPDRDPYDVVVDKDGARCTCKGHLFGKMCRHKKLAQSLAGQTS
jgi:hypothetical protein